MYILVLILMVLVPLMLFYGAAALFGPSGDINAPDYLYKRAVAGLGKFSPSVQYLNSELFDPEQCTLFETGPAINIDGTENVIRGGQSISVLRPYGTIVTQTRKYRRPDGVVFELTIESRHIYPSHNTRIIDALAVMPTMDMEYA